MGGGSGTLQPEGSSGLVAVACQDTQSPALGALIRARVESILNITQVQRYIGVPDANPEVATEDDTVVLLSDDEGVETPKLDDSVGREAGKDGWKRRASETLKSLFAEIVHAVERENPATG